MREFTITANHEAVIPTGPYQNQRFGFGISETVAVQDDKELEMFHKELGEKCYSLFKMFEQRAIEERIQLERKDFRFYKLASGESVPSVTSFLNYDADFFVSQEALQEYASQGTLLDKMAEHYSAKNQWINDPGELVKYYPELWTDYVIVKKGKIAFDATKWDYPAFLKKYPFKPIAWKVQVLNETDKYGGELDVYGTYEDILTMADYKRTPEKIKNFCQMACYAKALGKDIKQLMIIPCYPDNQQGFSKPIITDEIDKYYKIAMTKRQGFKKRYGI